MKKLVSILLVLALCVGLLALAGCGDSGAESSQPVQESPTATDEPVVSEPAQGPDEEEPAQEEPIEEEPAGEVYTYTTTELCFYRDGLKIFGELSLPDGEGPFPVVILSHGYGGNHAQCSGMVARLASVGVAAYAFDFIGGGNSSSSDGTPLDMTVLTEAADLCAVLDGLAAMPEIDADNIILMGFSQGGLVSTYVAASRPDDVKALVAYYPAYVIHDDAAEALAGLESDVTEIKFMGMTISRDYYEVATSFSIFDMMPNYAGDVVIFHGTSDTIAPIEYSYKAAELFPSVELVTAEGKSHGNLGTDIDDQAIAFVLEHIG